MSIFYQDSSVRIINDYTVDKKKPAKDSCFPVRICPKCGRKFDKSATSSRYSPGYYFLNDGFPGYGLEKEECIICKGEKK